ncbi:glycosyltransferase [Thalassotalea euphylliae]|uniref:Glycosyltransferase family 1 protein n=1 Tax=Thalassotalea euphylliae TaxID=1655234 RepID=A0A3E0U4R6_9GAMM|nr:glycosyltransferase [Thalassotalea euphylliae]REL31991.1 glycosyltransferase family 1 protein [Thalassotalea euphylliae]
MVHVISEYRNKASVECDRQVTRVLYVHFGDNWLRGSEIVLLDMISSAQQQGYQPVLWCNSQLLADEAKQLGIEVICQPMVCIGYWFKPRWQFGSFIRQLVTARKLIKRCGIQLVHCNNGAPCQWLSLACKYLKVPLLLHLHARYQYFDRLALGFAGADFTVGVSHSVTEVFRQAEPNQKSYSVIYNGIEQQRAVSEQPTDLRSIVGATDKDTVMLYVGSLIARKGLATLISAIAQVSSQDSSQVTAQASRQVMSGATSQPQVKLAIVGEGEEKHRLMMQVESLGLSEQVFFLGEQQDVAALYSSNVDCFVSVPSEEVFGLTLAEASLANLPVITTDVPGVNEIYQDNVNARLVPAGNIKALAEAISEYTRHPSRFKGFANAAQRHIAQSFSCQHQFQQFDTCYHETVARGSQKSFTWFVGYQLSQVSNALLAKVTSKISQGLKQLGVRQVTAK